MEAVAVYLRDLRDAAKLTQAAAAERVGVNKKTIERWEAGKHEPPASELVGYVRVLGGEVSKLLRLLVGPDPQLDVQFNLSQKHRETLAALSDEDLDLLVELAGRLQRSQAADQ